MKYKINDIIRHERDNFFREYKILDIKANHYILITLDCSSKSFIGHKGHWFDSEELEKTTNLVFRNRVREDIETLIKD